ncbi:MAG: hypothetical protein LBM38_02515 [Clostridiales bacterium]|jgi:hypothetical protein|nr:hypothetical protein [Clostridiales bacterium]
MSTRELLNNKTQNNATQEPMSNTYPELADYLEYCRAKDKNILSESIKSSFVSSGITGVFLACISKNTSNTLELSVTFSVASLYLQTSVHTLLGIFRIKRINNFEQLIDNTPKSDVRISRNTLKLLLSHGKDYVAQGTPDPRTILKRIPIVSSKVYNAIVKKSYQVSKPSVPTTPAKMVSR